MKCENCNASHKSAADITICEICGKEICSICGILSLGDSVNNWTCEDCQEITYQYPEGFHDFSNGKNISNDRIKDFLNSCKRGLKGCKDSDFTFTGTGNTVVIGLKLVDEYIFYVCKNYQEISIPYDKINEVEF